jgi:hypothetical protein
VNDKKFDVLALSCTNSNSVEKVVSMALSATISELRWSMQYLWRFTGSVIMIATGECERHGNLFVWSCVTWEYVCEKERSRGTRRDTAFQSQVFAIS